MSAPSSSAWERPERIKEVRDRIWSYVSLAARLEGEGLLAAAALLRWPESDALRLGELQFLLSPQVGSLLDAMPQLARALSVSSDREEESSRGRLRGPVQWQATLQARLASGASIFVTAPSTRVYQTPENELLVHVLDAISEIGRAGGWQGRASRDDASRIMQDRLGQAEFWRQHRTLASVKRKPPTPRNLSRVISGRHLRQYQPVLDAYQALASLVHGLDRAAIRTAIERAGLITASDSTLFELLVTFEIIDALNIEGWQLRPFRLFYGSVHTFGERADGRRLDLWYQSTPRNLATGEKYAAILRQHGVVDNRPLRPDLILSWTDTSRQSRKLIVECKLSQKKGVLTAARRGLADVLCYRRAFDAALTGSGEPYGLAIAWGAGLEPDLGSEVMLCTPDGIPAAIRTTAY
jgi:hypothetical protein